MDIAQFLTALGRSAPWDKAAGWDPVGLQIGDQRAEVETVAVCHEVTERVVAAIEQEETGLLVSYHPLLFRPTVRLVAGSSPSGRALRMVEAGTALAVAHTNFDVAPGGVADALADALGLVEVSGFGAVESADTVKVVTFVPEGSVELVTGALAAAGAGSIGNYEHCSYRTLGTGTFWPNEGATPATGDGGRLNREPEVRVEMIAPAVARDAVVRALVAAHPYEEPAFDVYTTSSNMGMVGRVGSPSTAVTFGDLAALVGERLGDRGLRVSGELSRPVGRIAVVPGSGSSYLAAAASAGADVVVTGDVSHHRTVEAADRGMAIIDPGHLATERPGVKRLYAAVADIVPDPTDLTELDAVEGP